MPASILRATFASPGADESAQIIRWPDDGPALLEQQWTDLAPALDAMAGTVGSARVVVDEALAFPEFTAMAAIRRLSLVPQGEGVCLWGDPISIASLVALAASVAYAEDRVAGMPLDVVSKLHPQLRRIPGIATATGAVAACREWLRQLRDPSRWLLDIDDGDGADRPARVLSLIGVHPASGGGAAHRVDDADGGYRLRIPMRGARKEALRLARSGSNLLVTTDGVTIPIDLAPVLKRCRVSGARVDGGELVVDFAIDKGKWPR